MTVLRQFRVYHGRPGHHATMDTLTSFIKVVSNCPRLGKRPPPIRCRWSARTQWSITPPCIRRQCRPTGSAGLPAASLFAKDHLLRSQR
jgi:hypothetical protein